MLRLPPIRQSAFLIPSAFALEDEEAVDCVEDLCCFEEVEDELLLLRSRLVDLFALLADACCSSCF
jgi:hypothetical protein